MAQFSQEELLNELSRILRGRLEPVKDGGLVDPAAIHSQIIEIAKTVFLLNPGAIFYLAHLVRNSLFLVLRQEIAVIEDMLIAVDDLSRTTSVGRIGSVGPTEINNATTALLALESAGSVSSRPELLRFQRVMDRFTGLFKGSIVDSRGRLVLPRGEARFVLRENLANLKQLHTRLLELIDGMTGLVDEFNELDIPTQVSQTALINMRLQLLELKRAIEESTEESLIRDARLIVLRSLASKVVAALLEQFSTISLTVPKLTSDNTGSAFDSNATDGPYLLKAAGEGEAAFVLTSPGPWRLDELDSSVLTLKIDGGNIQTIDLSVVQGPGLHGRNKAPFSDAQLYPVWPGPGGPTDPPPPPQEDYEQRPNIHVIVDSHSYEFTSSEWGHVDVTGVFYGSVDLGGGNLDPDLRRGDLIPATLIDSPRSDLVFPTLLFTDYYNTVRLQPPRKLGFKHLGTQMFIALGEVPEGSFGTANAGAGFGGWDVDGQDTLADATEWNSIEARRWDYVLRPRTVYDLELLDIVTLTHISGETYSVGGNVAEPHWVGFYVRVGSSHATFERYEITHVEPDGSAIQIALRGAPTTTISGATMVFGQRGDRSQVTFFPDLLADTNLVADAQTGTEHCPASVPNTAAITIAPAIKTARIPAGQGSTITAAVAALNNAANGDYDSLDNKYQHASYHCLFLHQNGFNDRITVQNRSRFLPEELQITDTFFKTKMFLPPRQTTGEPRLDNPGPDPIERVQQSGHEVFGFDVGQKADPNVDPFLSIEELKALLDDTIDADTTIVEIIETDVFAGLLTTVAGTYNISDPTADFSTLGIGLGYILEIKDGDNSGMYFIESALGPSLVLARPPDKPSTGFVGNETDVPYRILTQQLKISSVNSGPGSSVEVTTAPSSFDLPTSIVYGTVPSVEAVNADGQNLDLSRLSAGDESDGMVIESISDDGTLANVVGGVSSNVLNLRFSFDGITESTLATLITNLRTIKQSRNLLARYNFDSDVDIIDQALTSLITPGQAFQSNQNQARVVLAQLLGALTSLPLLSTQYSATIPDLSLDIQSTITPYSAPRVRALDALLDSLNEHGFDRALALLITGRLKDFFDTTAATASYAGALLESAKTVAEDVPTTSSVQSDVEAEINTADGFRVDTDSDEDFSDTDGEAQDIL